jgi:prepilin-type N-terminal cleavage/methylation domain-containing protein
MVMRRGFGLVEVIVAMTLLGVGVLSIAAGAAFASRIVSIAETEENAARLAATILDSLAVLPSWTDGVTDTDRLHARWSAGAAGDEATVVISVRTDSTTVFTYMTTTPPRLPLVPVAQPEVVP